MAGLNSLFKLMVEKRFFLFLMSFFATSPGYAESLLILGVNFPPYEIENPVDDRRGFDLEVIEASFEIVDVETRFDFVPWNRAKKIVEDGRAAALMSCSYRPEREEYYLFSDEISRSTRGVYALASYSGPDINKIEDVKDKVFADYSIGVVHGYAPEKILKQMQISYDPAPNDVSGLRKLIAGRTDLFLSTKESTQYFLHDMGDTTELKFFRLFEARYRLCVSKKWPEAEKLIQEFNRGLNMLIFSGDYDKIHARYQ